MQGYLPVRIQSLKDCFKDLPVDLFLSLESGRHVRAFDSETGLDFGRLSHYEAKGVQYLYYRIEDRAALDAFFSRSPMMSLMNANSPMELRRKAFWAVMEQSLIETFSPGVKDTENAQIYKAFEALRHGLKDDRDFISILSALLKAAPPDNLFVKHAISTALYCHVIAHLSKLTSPRTTRILVFAAFFHDLGKMNLPEEIRSFVGIRPAAVQREYSRHPELTIELMKKAVPIGDEEIRRCILQHRERLDGRGYPNGLRGSQVYPLARILAIADAFSERVLGLEDGIRYSRAQALAEIRADEGHYDTKLLILFSEAINRVPKRGSKAA
jgi:HD-GYP domain-containing protein (c-di-GMP phosphodiesterase class II)